MTLSQGGKANKNGKIFEQMMLPIFKEHGFLVMSETDFKKLKAKPDTGKLVLTNSQYTTIYGRNGRTEFVIYNDNRAIRVENKWQQAEGSVDEKYPYMYINGVFAYPEREVIFVVDGNGYKAEARKWLEKQIENDWLEYKEKGKDIKLMTIAEFMTWFNNEFD